MAGKDSVIRTIWLNLVVLCVLLVLLELIGQIGYRIVSGRWLPHFSGYNRVFEHHPYLVARMKSGVVAADADSEKLISATARHTRVTSQQPGIADGQIRVAVVGGSTTFGTGVTDHESWPALLQQALGRHYHVENYGMPGYSSAEALIQLALIVPEYKPDVIIFYQGWNDIRNYHDETLSSDYFNHGLMQYGNLGIPRAPNTFEKIAAVSAIANGALRLTRKLNAGEGLQKEPQQYALSEPDPRVDQVYVRNMRTLKALASHFGAYPVFVPQILNDASFKKANVSRAWTPFISDQSMPRLIRRFNQLLLEVCPHEDATCEVLWEMESMDWRPRDFVDDGHFNKRGGHKFVEPLAERIRAIESI